MVFLCQGAVHGVVMYWLMVFRKEAPFSVLLYND